MEPDQAIDAVKLNGSKKWDLNPVSSLFKWFWKSQNAHEHHWTYKIISGIL